MEPEIQRDPAARERARRRRVQQVQRRRLVFGICVLGLIVVISALVVGLPRGSDTPSTTSSTGSQGSTTTSLVAATYTADLTGAQSVPAVRTEATASLALTYDPDAAALTFVLDVKGLTNPSVSTIYEGTPGAPGAAVLTLFAGPSKTGKFSGTLKEGTIKDADLTGPLQGKTVGDLIALIKAGNAYVSVGNTSHPVDAIRGQIK
jgi:hypothetical protein